MKKQILIEEYKRMQKIAGLLNESKVDEIGMFHDPIGYNKKSKSQLSTARDILRDAGLSPEEIQNFIDDNMFKKGRLDDKAQEYVNSLNKPLNEDITSISKSDLKNIIKEMFLDEKNKKKEEKEVEDEESTEEEEIDFELEDETPPTENSDILDSLRSALEGAKAIGDEKLIQQIGNSITFYTRTHIVGQPEEEI